MLPLFFVLLSIVVARSVAFPERAAAQQSTSAAVLTLAETENLARRVDYEGLPEDEAARIGPQGAARLVEMLADPDEKPHHARILLALGIWGGDGALEAMRNWASMAQAEGELDRDRFRAWQILPFALGKLAQRDPRAVAELATRFDAEAPRWSFRQFRGARLQDLERRAAATASRGSAAARSGARARCGRAPRGGSRPRRPYSRGACGGPGRNDRRRAMSVRRVARRAFLLVLPLALIAAGRADAGVAVDLHQLRWYVHVDLINPAAGRDLRLLAGRDR